MPDPKVQLQAPALAPVVSRPLRTAASFVQEKARHEELLRKKDQQQAAPKQAAGGKHR